MRYTKIFLKVAWMMLLMDINMMFVMILLEIIIVSSLIQLFFSLDQWKSKKEKMKMNATLTTSRSKEWELLGRVSLKKMKKFLLMIKNKLSRLKKKRGTTKKENKIFNKKKVVILPMSLSTTRLRNQTVLKIFLIEVLKAKANKLAQRAFMVNIRQLFKS